MLLFDATTSLEADRASALRARCQPAHGTKNSARTPYGVLDGTEPATG